MELEQRKSEASTGRAVAPVADVEVGHSAENMGVVAKGYKLGPFTLPAYRSPLAQVILIGFVCFLVVGKNSMSCRLARCNTHGDF